MASWCDRTETRGSRIDEVETIAGEGVIIEEIEEEDTSEIDAAGQLLAVVQIEDATADHDADHMQDADRSQDSS